MIAYPFSEIFKFYYNYSYTVLQLNLGSSSFFFFFFAPNIGSDTGVWKQYDLKLQTRFIWMPFLGAIKGVFSAISKLIPTWIVVSFILYEEKLKLRYGSKKKEPRNITFDDLAGVDATICELRYVNFLYQYSYV